MTGAFADIDTLQADLWEAADNLRANSKLTSSDYFMPVLGVIFLRHAANMTPLLAQQDNLHRQNDRLRAARDLLLPRLMSGEIAA